MNSDRDARNKCGHDGSFELIRLHVDAPLSAGAAVPLGPDQAHYLLNVMRRAVGDEVLLFNGRDGEWRAAIAHAAKRGAILSPLVQVRPQVTPPDLDLIVAVVKRARLETIVEKAAELGARRVLLVFTRRTNADRARLDRLQAIAVEAAEQTGRLDVPQIHAPEPLDRLLDAWPEDRRLIFCDEGAYPSPSGEGPPRGARQGGEPSTDPHPAASQPPSPEGEGGRAPALIALAQQPPGPWSILIGPEGGFDPAERVRLHAAPFATGASLGPRILRADTAAIAAMTLWQASLGDWA